MNRRTLLKGLGAVLGAGPVAPILVRGFEPERAADPLPSWNDGAAKKALLELEGAI